MPAGRPSDYRPEYCARVIALGKLGKSKAQIACDLDVMRETVDDWAKRNPDFSDAIKHAMQHALAWWENAGMQGMFAEKFNATAFIFQMKNRFRDDYRDVREANLIIDDKRDATDWTKAELVALIGNTPNGSGGTHPPNGRAREPDKLH